MKLFLTLEYYRELWRRILDTAEKFGAAMSGPEARVIQLLSDALFKSKKARDEIDALVARYPWLNLEKILKIAQKSKLFLQSKEGLEWLKKYVVNAEVVNAEVVYTDAGAADTNKTAALAALSTVERAASITRNQQTTSGTRPEERPSQAIS